MNKIAKLTFITSLLYLNTVYSAIPNHDDPTTFLGPTFKTSYTRNINNISAYSFLGEAGLKNFRLGGTLAWRLDVDHRLKLSAEWLEQEITYAFFSGNVDQWMHQWAVGLAYQYDFADENYFPTFDLSIYYSQAPSKTLSTKTGIFINSQNHLRTYIDQRRIAGSKAGGINPGISFSPWVDARANIELNYDNVRFDKKYSQNRDAKGFGGTIRLDQGLTENVTFGLSAAVRKPFNNYTGNLDWGNVPYLGGAWTIGLEAAYTIGKESMPNTWDAGLSFNYLLGPCPKFISTNFKNDYKGEAIPLPVKDPFWAWATKPAVYMPQVLAIVDERVITGCIDGTIPIVIGTIPSQTFTAVETGTIATAQAFSGNNLVFSMIANPTNPANTISINSITGVITVNANDGDNFNVTVTALNSCGFASTTFNIVIEED